MTSNKTFLFINTLLLVLLIGSSCKKNSTGGKAEVHALIFKGTKAMIGNNTVYVKFNANTAANNPTENYDLKVSGEIDDNHVHIEGLRPGHYYFFAQSYDSTLKKNVYGGIAVDISWSERKKMTDVSIQVSE